MLMKGATGGYWLYSYHKWIPLVYTALTNDVAVDKNEMCCMEGIHRITPEMTES